MEFNNFMEESERINWLEQKVEDDQSEMDILRDKIEELKYLNEGLEEENSNLNDRLSKLVTQGGK